MDTPDFVRSLLAARSRILAWRLVLRLRTVTFQTRNVGPLQLIRCLAFRHGQRNTYAKMNASRKSILMVIA
ncbi:hypothetical protein EJB05_47773, partial [Eragrostis curvula]